MGDWKKKLNEVFEEAEEKGREKEKEEEKAYDEAENFLSKVIIPAFKELKLELERHGKNVEIGPEKVIRGYPLAYIKVRSGDQEEITFKIEVKIPRAYPEIKYEHITDKGLYETLSTIRSGVQDYTVSDISKEEIIEAFLRVYRDYIR